MPSTPLLCWLSFLVLMVVTTNSLPAEEPAPGKQVEQDVKISVRFWLSLPEDYDGKTPTPLLIFLHGRGERGDNLDDVLLHGPPKLIKAGRKMPFIVVSPQLPQDYLWWQTGILSEWLDRLEKDYAIDTDRIYLTGLSMGGYGTWAWGAKEPDRFAALAPVCGGGETEWAPELAKTPIWAFHGAKDPVVPVELSKEMVAAVKKEGGEAKLTIYPEAGHNSWDQAYDTEELYKWFLSHKRHPPPPAQ